MPEKDQLVTFLTSKRHWQEFKFILDANGAKMGVTLRKLIDQYINDNTEHSALSTVAESSDNIKEIRRQHEPVKIKQNNNYVQNPITGVWEWG